MDIIQDLENRGLITQVNDIEALRKRCNEGPIGFYIGFDPTADSLHVGSLLQLLVMKRLIQAGHRAYGLVGGSTGLIGDPSFKDTERPLHTEDIVQEWTQKLSKQIAKVSSVRGDGQDITMVNNYDWTSKMTIFEYLRDVGKHFTINYMTAKESVKKRIETGISYTEFSYSLLQALDFNYLYNHENVSLQIGGNDQWGNITSGLELIRRSHEGETQAFAFTTPLVTTSDGKKFGKSEGNAIWLDAEKTSPYEFYQFWYNTSDQDVIQYLQYFTFLTQDEISVYVQKVEEAPHLREAQRALAWHVTNEVHGKEAVERAVRISEVLFKGDIASLTRDEIKEGFHDLEPYVLEGTSNLIDLLVASKTASSKREAREFITNKSIRINGVICDDLEKIVSAKDAIDSEVIVLRRGKKKYTLIQLV